MMMRERKNKETWVMLSVLRVKNQGVVVEDDEINERGRSYFHKLFNENHIRG